MGNGTRIEAEHRAENPKHEQESNFMSELAASLWCMGEASAHLQSANRKVVEGTVNHVKAVGDNFNSGVSAIQKENARELKAAGDAWNGFAGGVGSVWNATAKSVADTAAYVHTSAINHYEQRPVTATAECAFLPLMLADALIRDGKAPEKHAPAETAAVPTYDYGTVAKMFSHKDSHTNDLHTVAKGESLWSIVRERAHTNDNTKIAALVSEMVKANPSIKNPHQLNISQVVMLPEGLLDRA